MFDAQSFLTHLTRRPGVYCMRDKAGKVLYIGKAKNLKNRLTSYFRETEDLRLHQLVSKIAEIDVTVTPSEKEALLLENSLIKSLKPKYNVIFRDDKSYPFLFLSEHRYPRLIYLRGKHRSPGKYYGPYPSAKAVKDTLILLQKLFKIRQCDDIFFNNRSRPCLQYQIKRCTAPCVDFISPEAYANNVQNVALFLEGKENAIIENLVQKMETSAIQEEFELAAQYRDQIAQLRVVYDQQIIFKEEGNADVLAVCELKGHFCIQLLYIRHGQILDSQSFFPKQIGTASASQILRGFLIQFYLAKTEKFDYPHEIVLSQTIEDKDVIMDTLSQMVKRKVQIIHPTRGEKTKWLKLAAENALQALERKTQHINASMKRWLELKKVLGITATVSRIECFDVSHMQGEATMASCVVFEENGPQKTEYRRYHLQVPANDDYAAIEQVLTKRYLKRKSQEQTLPEIIIVDGGKGQLTRAKKALLECQILDLLLIGIAKGRERKPGLETLYIARPQTEDDLMVKLPPHSPALHLLQQIRDEAHRFAITGQRQKTRSTRQHSPLESIPGVGAKRRQKLLNYFGGQQALLAASEEAIAKVPDIGPRIAAKIYKVLHGI